MSDSTDILIADDDPTNRFVLKKMVQLCGYESTLAGDGCEAVDAVGTPPPRLILMDISMPNLNGVEAARIIRAGHRADGVPIVAVTANVTPHQRQECADAGFDDFLAKPVELDQLREVIERYLAA